MEKHLLTLVVLLAVGPIGYLSKEPSKWWQNTIIYEIYPQSFYDSNGDGYGDLNGITEKIDYLKELGIGAVWLNPIYTSPLKDNGYDISNFKEIDPRFGTMKDFENLVQTLKHGGYSEIKVILDFVPNHTSDQHEWFQKSVQKISPYTDYYIWKDPKDWKDGNPTPPNNWESLFKQGEPGSAWKWNNDRKQFYYHAFMEEQPDLNYRNPLVLKEMKDVLQFWMEKGVEGFRADAVPHLFEDERMLDEPRGEPIYTQNLPDTYRIIEEFRETIDKFSEANKVDIFFTTEGYTSHENTLRYYGSPSRPGAHFPFNFLLLTNLDADTGALSLNRTVSHYLSSLEKYQFPNWVSGNHDWPRIPSRLGADSAVDQMNMLNLLLPGTATVYMGDEIGMDSYWNLDKSSCPAGVRDDYRTPSRTPFHWSGKKNAGFTSAEKPWIPINPEYYLNNVEHENRDLPLFEGMSTHLQNFKKLVQMKRYPSFTEGKTKTYALNHQIFAFTRSDVRHVYLVLLNLSKGFSDHFRIFQYIPELKKKNALDIELQSVNLADDCPDTPECINNVFSGYWNMPPKSGLVLSFKKNRPKGGWSDELPDRPSMRFSIF